MPVEKQVRFILNGLPDSHSDPEMSLLRYLREIKGLTGAKNGCGTGHCGTCTVLVDGRPARSCILKLSAA